MLNSNIIKNELIFQYASGTANLAKSLMAASYLFLNSKESLLFNEFENYCGQELNNVSKIYPKNLTANDCITDVKDSEKQENKLNIGPINKFIENLNNLKWKKIYKGFYEYSLKLSKNESAKLIKMDPGASVPLHSHNGKEYILVLEGSFCDEYGNYKKGELQINDSKIKHTPIASEKEGCICLTITEEDLIFYGPFGTLLNILTFIKSSFKFFNK